MASTSNPAQDEFDALIASSTQSKATHHPDDVSSSDSETLAASTSDTVASTSKSQTRSLHSHARRDSSGEDSSDEENTYPSRRGARKSSTYYLPRSYNADANTGPKGVIADAQAFEKEKRGKERRQGSRDTFERTIDLTLPKAQKNGGVLEAKRLENLRLDKGRKSDEFDEEEYDDDNDNDDEFLGEWRQRRLGELKQRKTTGAVDDKEKTYGTLEEVDGLEFLEVVETAPKDVVVVVFVFDEQRISAAYHSHLVTLAAKYTFTRFIALDHVSAEIDEAGVPALLAYKDGAQIAAIVPLIDDAPFTCNVVTNLEGAMRQHGIL